MRMLIATLTTALAATALVAQGPRETREGRRGPGTDAIQEALSLSDAQVTALKQYSEDLRTAMRTAFREASEKHQALQAELDSANPNPTIVGQIVIDAHKAREAGEKLREEYREKALAVLDQAQKNALTALVEEKGRTPALFQAGALNLLERPRGGPHDGPHGGRFGGFMGPRS